MKLSKQYQKERIMRMKITDVRVFKVDSEKLKANVSITFDEQLVMWVKLVDGKYGLYVNFPSHSYEGNDGKVVYKDDVFPITKDFRDDIIDAVIDAYEKESSKNSSRRSKR